MRTLATLACWLLWACSRNERATEAPPLRAASSASAGPAAMLAQSSVAGNAVTEGRVTAPTASGKAPPIVAGSILSVTPKGYASGLELISDTLTYCDDRGGRALDLTSGIESAHERRCPKKPEERNRGCTGVDVVASVDQLGADDYIDVNDKSSIHVNGHINDCVYDGGVLLYASWDEVVTIDVKTRHRETKSKRKEGAAQVAIDGSWIAWLDTKKVFAQRR